MVGWLTECVEVVYLNEGNRNEYEKKYYVRHINGTRNTESTSIKCNFDRTTYAMVTIIFAATNKCARIQSEEAFGCGFETFFQSASSNMNDFIECTIYLVQVEFDFDVQSCERNASEAIEYRNIWKLSLFAAQKLPDSVNSAKIQHMWRNVVYLKPGASCCGSLNMGYHVPFNAHTFTARNGKIWRNSHSCRYFSDHPMTSVCILSLNVYAFGRWAD